MKKNLPPAPFGHTWININSFTKKYISVMPQDLFIDLQSIILNGSTRVTITTSTIDALDELLFKRKQEDKKLSKCVSANNKGKEYEKLGKIKLAINTYEKNIEGDCYLATHSFDRLMILYRKDKDYDNEIRVIERAIEVFSGDSRYNDIVYKWTDRLSKVQQFKNK